MKNELVEEIRKVRCTISEQFQDIHSFIKHYQKLDKKYADRLLVAPHEIKKAVYNPEESESLKKD
jgi:hypothetical protein